MVFAAFERQARLTDLELPAAEPIDLITVAFGATPDEAPDRLTARNGLSELAALAPSRPWRLVEVDVSLPMLRAHHAQIEALLAPARTVMDLNIGAALWFGARGVGTLRTAPPPQATSHLCRYADEEAVAAPPAPPDARQRRRQQGAAAGAAAPLAVLQVRLEVHGGAAGAGGRRLELQVEWLGTSGVDGGGRDASGCGKGRGRGGGNGSEGLGARTGGGGAVGEEASGRCEEGQAYRSRARVLLLGMGADEQMGGYGRHRTAFRRGGWAGLAEELHARWWKRLPPPPRTAPRGPTGGSKGASQSY